MSQTQSRPNSRNVLKRIDELEAMFSTKHLELSNSLEAIQCTVDSAFLTNTNSTNGGHMSNPATTNSTPGIDLSQVMAMLQQNGAPSPAVPVMDTKAELNKLFDAKSEELAQRVLQIQEANKSFWTSPVFLGCVAGGFLLVVAGTLYYYNQRLNALEEVKS